eukprot:jgi/Tetstr1/423270/TSEL_013970.t1
MDPKRDDFRLPGATALASEAKQFGISRFVKHGTVARARGAAYCLPCLAEAKAGFNITDVDDGGQPTGLLYKPPPKYAKPRTAIEAKLHGRLRRCWKEQHDAGKPKADLLVSAEIALCKRNVAHEEVTPAATPALPPQGSKTVGSPGVPTESRQLMWVAFMNFHVAKDLPYPDLWVRVQRGDRAIAPGVRAGSGAPWPTRGNVDEAPARAAFEAPSLLRQVEAVDNNS